MTRFSRINTIWRKELTDTLRDRRTVIAMVLVPMVLYPFLMLFSLQAFELQISGMKREEYRIAVVSEAAQRWLRRLIAEDPAHRAGGEGKSAEELHEAPAETQPGKPSGARDDGRSKAVEKARTDVYSQPPDYAVEVLPATQLKAALLAGYVHAAVLLDGPPPPLDGSSSGSVQVLVEIDSSDPRSVIAATGLEGVFDRAAAFEVHQRLENAGLTMSFVRPFEVKQENLAPPERVSGSIIGQVVPLILIIMTITGAIYPAIDLTAGERERGTLETLMVAPVATVELIAGKFVVVALVGMLSAVLNLVSIGMTIWLGGLGELLTRGNAVVIPLNALPLVLLVLVPLTVMFSALLLAVCSFARSFKEAQNYVMPVIVAALIPAVVGVLPGTRLEGPLLIMPVANIVILTRDLFTGKFDVIAILWVLLSTTIYAGAAVGVAAKLFGQEAVLFADSASVKTIFQRKFFKPQPAPTAAQALLVLALVFSLNFFLQQALLKTPGIGGTINFFLCVAGVSVLLFVLLPAGAAGYMRVDPVTTFSLRAPRPLGLLAALCFGLSTWILARAWLVFQQPWLPMLPEMEQELQRMTVLLGKANPYLVVFLAAVVPAFCEEMMFRGYALSGLRRALGPIVGVLLVSFAFGVSHYSVTRLVIAGGLGLLLGILVVRSGSIWPAMLAHVLHNGIAVLAERPDGLKPFFTSIGYVLPESGMPPTPWLLGAVALTLVGIGLCLVPRRSEPRPSGSGPGGGSAE